VVVGFVSSAATTAAFVPANAIIAAVCPYRLRALGFALVGIYVVLIGGLGGALIAGSLSEAYGSRLAVAVVVPPAAFVGSYLLFIGARYVRSDMAAVVAELREEQAEATRALSGADVPALQIRNLDFSYGPVQVLFDVNIEVQRARCWPCSARTAPASRPCCGP
jgi:MFS family permease